MWVYCCLISHCTSSQCFVTTPPAGPHFLSFKRTGFKPFFPLESHFWRLIMLFPPHADQPPLIPPSIPCCLEFCRILFLCSCRLYLWNPHVPPKRSSAFPSFPRFSLPSSMLTSCFSMKIPPNYSSFLVLAFYSGGHQSLLFFFVPSWTLIRSVLIILNSNYPSWVFFQPEPLYPLMPQTFSSPFQNFNPYSPSQKTIGLPVAKNLPPLGIAFLLFPWRSHGLHFNHQAQPPWQELFPKISTGYLTFFSPFCLFVLTH